jgi:hypothetical protein
MSQEKMDYLLARHEQATAAATAAPTKAARVAHFELAYRYSVMLMETAAINNPASIAGIARG